MVELTEKRLRLLETFSRILLSVLIIVFIYISINTTQDIVHVQELCENNLSPGFHLE